MNTQGHGRPEEAADEPPVKLQAVVPTISAPVLHEPPSGNDDLGTHEPVMVLTIDVPWAGIPHPPLRRADLELAGAVGVIASLVMVDVVAGAIVGLLVWAFATLMRVGRRVPFSFGQGFVGYRSDLGWPQGVQEDDDFRWNWKPRANSQAR